MTPDTKASPPAPQAPQPMTPATKTSLLHKLVSEQPTPTAEAKQEVAAVVPPAETKAPPTEQAAVEDKKESKSSKAAKESKALRQAREEKAALQAELSKSKAVVEASAQLQKAQELFKTNPKEAIKLLGLDPNKTYQDLTDAFLAQDIDLQPKDQVKEKLKEIDPYLEQLKQQVEQQNVQIMITNHVAPTITAKRTELECLFGYFDPDGKNDAKQVEKAVMQCVFDNGADHFAKQYKGDHKELLKEFGNYPTYFEKVALHLEKQLEQELDKLVQRAERLPKFKNRFQPKTEATQSAATTPVKADAAPAKSQATFSVLDPNSNDNFSLAAVSSTPSSDLRTFNPDKRAAINKMLKDQGLET